MKASIVIPTYNKLGRLKLVMESLKHQTVSMDDIEVIVVDDGSNDGTIDYLSEETFSFGLRIIKQQHKGRACARNTGVRNANFEIVIFTDDDLILHKDFIKAHLERHEEKEQVVHGKVYNLPRTKFFKNPTEGTFIDELEIRPSVKKILSNERIFPSMLISDESFSENIIKKSKVAVLEQLIHCVLEEYPGKMDWISFVGGNVSVPKSLLEDVKGFDENFGLKWGCEDVELGYRLMLKKVPFRYSDEAANYHITHYRVDFSKEHESNLEYFYEKYQDDTILSFHDFISEKITKEEMINRILTI